MTVMGMLLLFVMVVAMLTMMMTMLTMVMAIVMMIAMVVVTIVAVQVFSNAVPVTLVHGYPLITHQIRNESINPASGHG